MIRVEHLTKHYGSVKAVNGISFSVEKGEIVGLLGLNGAGKSTTMRMLSCYLPPTSGRAEISGFDVFHDSIRARERIGYMPENVPLPADMRVKEYLAFRAKLKGVLGRRVNERVADVCELCGLENGMEKRMIATLSKGYRQRVGLADAMIHEPDLLILDEPTIGLDPNQIRQVRTLIKNLSRHHTILLSTHILPEVEMTCSRVIIIGGGKIQAQGTPETLRQRLGTGPVLVEARVPDLQIATSQLQSLRGVETVETQPTDTSNYWTRFLLTTSRDGVRPLVFDLAKSQNWSLRTLDRQHISLEEVFAEVTEENL